MKEYKVESFIFYTKMTFDSKHIIKRSTKEMQAKLDEYSKEGWVWYQLMMLLLVLLYIITFITKETFDLK